MLFYTLTIKEDLHGTKFEIIKMEEINLKLTYKKKADNI